MKRENLIFGTYLLSFIFIVSCQNGRKNENLKNENLGVINLNDSISMTEFTDMKVDSVKETYFISSLNAELIIYITKNQQVDPTLPKLSFASLIDSTDESIIHSKKIENSDYLTGYTIKDLSQTGLNICQGRFFVQIDNEFIIGEIYGSNEKRNEIESYLIKVAKSIKNSR
jgi:hypothetical protein